MKKTSSRPVGLSFDRCGSSYLPYLEGDLAMGGVIASKYLSESFDMLGQQ